MQLCPLRCPALPLPPACLPACLLTRRALLPAACLPQEEQQYLEGSDFEGISDSSSEEEGSGSEGDDDWQPGGRRRKSGASNPRSGGGKQKRSRQ